MRFQILLPTLLSLGALAACTAPSTSPTAATEIAAPWAALVTPGLQTEFEGFIHFCGSTPPEEVIATDGGTLHLRGGTNRNRWVTGNPLVDGVENNVVNGEINLQTGAGVGHLQVTVRPDAVDGTWEIRQTLEIVGGIPAGSSGVGHGTGELLGMSIQFITLPAVFGQNTCNPARPSARLQGVIITPASLD